MCCNYKETEMSVICHSSKSNTARVLTQFALVCQLKMGLCMCRR